MARMPGADWLGEHSPKTPMSRYDIVCVHTIVGYAPAHAAHFSTWGSGRIGQSRDTRYRSAANLHGNHRILAIENADHGPEFPTWGGSDVPPLTDAQVAANGRILAFAHAEHGIPLQLCPDSRPGSRGLAYHRQGIDGNFGSYRYPGRVSGGEVWSSAFGKVCPGDKRIAQLPDILDAALTIRRGGTLTIQEDDMPTAEELAKAFWDAKLPTPGKGSAPITAKWALTQARSRAGNAQAAAQAASKAVADLARLVADTSLTAEARTALAEDIAARVAAEVDRLDADAVAERLQITTKE